MSPTTSSCASAERGVTAGVSCPGMPSRAVVKSSRASAPAATPGLIMSPTISSWASAERGAKSASSPGIPSRAVVKSSRASAPAATPGLMMSPTTSSCASAERAARLLEEEEAEEVNAAGSPSRSAVKSSSKSNTGLSSGVVMAVMASSSPSPFSNRSGMAARSAGRFWRVVVRAWTRASMSVWMAVMALGSWVRG